MKRFSFFSIAVCLSLFCVSIAFAQEGVVTYEEVVKMNIQLPPEMEDMRENFPSTQKTMRQLFFNESAALLKDVPEDDDHDVNLMNHEGNIHIKMQRAENQLYFNFDEGKQIEKTDFMGRTFLIHGEMSNLAWKLTDERSEFLGYMSQKATAIKDSTTYEAWFTPEISVPAGPGQGGLPGLILVMNVDDGQRTYVAKEIEMGPIESGIIKPPKKGKKVSRDEYDKIVEEKMKEMDATSNGQGVVIRMRRDG